MARTKNSNGHKTVTPDVSHIRNVEVTHEKSDINVRAVLKFIIVLTLATIAVAVGMWQLFNYFTAETTTERRPGPMALRPEERLPPEPRLQAAPGFAVTLEDGRRISLEKTIPQAEYRALRLQWQENLRTGLKDSTGNVVGMSIDAAIDKVVAGEGLPTRDKGTPRKIEEHAISMPTAASSGREMEKKLQ